MGLKVFGNIDATSLNTAAVASANDLRPKQFKPLAAGDRTVVDLFLTGSEGLQDIRAYPTIRLGIGPLNARPETGSFTYGAQTVTFSTDQAQLGANIDVAITIEDGANVTVTSLGGFAYEVLFEANGARTIADVDAANLNPSSTVSILEIQEGTASQPAKWLLRLFANPIALVDTFTNIDGNGIRGSLNMGTIGVYDLLENNASVQTTIELEITDADGNIQTIFQMPLTITGEVIGQGVTGLAEFSNYASTTALASANTVRDFVIVSGEQGSDVEGERERQDKPFATPSAAVAVATANDVIIIRDGNFSNSQITVPDGVTVVVNPSAIGPICVSTATRSFIMIGPFSGIRHQGTGTVTLDGVNMNFVEVTATATGGQLTVINSSIHARASDANRPANIDSLGANARVVFDKCKILNDRDDNIVRLTDVEGDVHFLDTKMKGTEATTTAIGVQITGTLTGSVQMKDCTIISPSTSVGGFSSPVKTINVQGVLNVNQDDDPYVELNGGMQSVNSGYDI